MSNLALDAAIAEALIGIDTLWGGDVMNPSGIGRFIADCWFSDEPLPAAYTHPAGSALRANGGVGARTPDVASVQAYLDAVDMRGAIDRVLEGARATAGLRGAYLEGLGLCCEVMWDLAMEIVGQGPQVPYDRCVRTITGRPPERSEPGEKRRRVAELLAAAGHAVQDRDALLQAVDEWRAGRRVPSKSIAAVGDAFVAYYDALAARNLVPYLPAELERVPRADEGIDAERDGLFEITLRPTRTPAEAPHRARRIADCSAAVETVVLPIDKPLGEALAPLLDIAGAETAELPDIAPEDDATILFTSGSTGDSKGAVSTHRAVTTAVYAYANSLVTLLGLLVEEGRPPASKPRVLLAVPLFHVTGEVPVMLTSFVIGRCMVMMDKWNSTEALRLIEKERITYFVGVPTMSLEVTPRSRPRPDRFGTHPARHASPW